ncbi:hypothetical protein Tco_0464881 [Tanacetum coccineum]
MSSAIPIGSKIERSVNSSVMQVGVSSGRERVFQTEYGIRLMLAPRSSKALHVLIPENSHGIRNRPGSPSFFGNLFRMTAEQFSFNGVLAISLNFSLFPIKVFRVEANFGISIKASVKEMELMLFFGTTDAGSMVGHLRSLRLLVGGIVVLCGPRSHVSLLLVKIEIGIVASLAFLMAWKLPSITLAFGSGADRQEPDKQEG